MCLRTAGILQKDVEPGALQILAVLSLNLLWCLFQDLHKVQSRMGVWWSEQALKLLHAESSLKVSLVPIHLVLDLTSLCNSVANTS